MLQTKTKRILSSVSSALIVSALAVGMQVPLAATSPAFAGSSPWLDRDNTGGVGDFESTHQLLQFQCRIVGSNVPVSQGQPHAGYHAGGKTNHGCWCNNQEAAEAGGTCEDIQIKYFWQ